VGAVVRAGYGIRKLKAAEFYAANHYSGMAATIAAAIEDWFPDILIPCDEPALHYLQELHMAISESPRRHRRRVMELLQTSLGDPASFDIARKKSEFIAFALREGIPVPESVIVRREPSLREQMLCDSYPVVLKIDGSWGGIGVRIARNPEEADRAFAELLAQSSWPHMVKQSVKKLSVEPLARFLKAPPPAISLQRYVDGWPACRSIACREGDVLAGLSLQAVQTSSETGPSTVVQTIENPEMAEIAKYVVRRLRLSGLIGFDFVIEAGTRRPFLIEMNARATPTCHLSLDERSDLTGALAATFPGDRKRRPATIPTANRIALFPQELWRDPGSMHLRTSYHDVPWDNPAFIAAYALPLPAEFPIWVGTLRRLARSVKPLSRWTRKAAGSLGSMATRTLTSIGATREPL